MKHATRAIVLAVLAWPLAARAQEPADAPAPPPNATPSPPANPPAAEPAPAPAAPPPAEVRVIGEKADSLRRVPGSGTIITSQEIQRAQPYDAAEMLNRVPGVTAREEQEGGARLDIGVRGLDPGRSRNLLVLEDGIPVTLNPYGEPDLYVAPQMDRMRGIEVVKGSGSVLFGPSTIGGVINFLTLNPPSRESASVAADYGSYAYRRVLGQYGNAFGSARYLVQADYKGGDGPRADGFTSIDTFGKVAIDTSKTGTLTLKLSFHDDLSIAEDVGLTRDMFTSDPRAPVLDPHDQMHQRRYAASAIYEQPLGETTTLRALAYAYETQRTWRRQHFQRTTPGGAPPGSFERFVGTFAEPGEGLWFLNSDAILDRTYDVAGVEPRFETKLRTGPVEHDFSYGARVLGETARYSVLAGGTFDSDTGADQNEERHRSVGVAAYVDDAIAFRDDLVVTPGLRYEHVDSHRIVLRTTGTTTADVNQPGDLSSGSFIPGIGMVLGARDHHVFGGLFYGWQPPRVASSFSPKGTPLPVSPQTAINYEIGARVSPAKWARTEVTGFLISYENEVVSGAGSSAELTNGGPTRHVGGEGSAVVQIGRALEWKTALDLIARYNYARATFVGGPNAGNFVPYAPLSTFNAVADVQHPSGFGAEVAFYYFGWQYADATNIYAQDATGQYGLIPAHTNLDANARYKWEKTGLTFRLAVKNALDQVYVSERRPQGIAVGGFREVLAGVRWDWDAGPPREEK